MAPSSLLLDEMKTVEAELHVGDYEKRFIGTDEDNWRNCAGRIVDDIRAWLKANRERLVR